MKSNIYPVKITAKSEGIENAETLLQEKRLQIGLSEPDTAEIKGGAISYWISAGNSLAGYGY